MGFLMKLFVSQFIFLNLFVHTNPQDIVDSILGGVQNGLNLLNNNLKVGLRDYLDFGSPVNKDVSFSGFNEVSQSNQIGQNESEEPDRSNSEQHGGYDSQEEEYHKENSKYILNNKTLPVHRLEIAQQNRSSVKHSVPIHVYIHNKTDIRKPIHPEKQKPLRLKNLNISNVTQNKNSMNPNVTSLNAVSSTSVPLLFLVNTTVIDKDTPSLSIINDSLKQNVLNSTDRMLLKTVEKDNKNVLKPMTKKKFFFQARPVIPLDMEVNINETIYYIDID